MEAVIEYRLSELSQLREYLLSKDEVHISGDVDNLISDLNALLDKMPPILGNRVIIGEPVNGT